MLQFFLIIFGKNTCCMPQPIHNDAKAPSSPTLKKEKLFSRPKMVIKVQLSVFCKKMGCLVFFRIFSSKNGIYITQPIYNGARAPFSPTLKKEKLFSRSRMVIKIQLSVSARKWVIKHFFPILSGKWYLYKTTYS